MELKEFIKTALMDIVSAVKETQEEVKEYATIAPLTDSGGEKSSAIKQKDGVAHVSNMDFDVAVTTETKGNTENGIKVGIKVASVFNIGASSKDNATETSQNISRIRFTIPVLLPCSASLDEIVFIGGKSFRRRELLDNRDR